MMISLPFVLGTIVLIKQKKMAIPLLLVFVVIINSACAGWSISGEMRTTTKLDQFNMAEGKSLGELLSDESLGVDRSIKPLYAVKGESVATFDIIEEVSASFFDESTTKSVRCTGTVTYRVNGYLFEDGLITESFLSD